MRSDAASFLSPLPWRDIVVGAHRSLRRRPWFAALSVLTLSLAIAANSSIYALWAALLAPPSSIIEPGSLVVASYAYHNSAAYPSLPGILAKRAVSYAGVSGFTVHQKALAVNGENYREVKPVTVLANYFAVLRVKRARGRLFSPNDVGTPARLAVINEGLARALFPAYHPVLGSTFLLGGKSATVVGVVENGFPADANVWLLAPLTFEPRNALGRLRDGVSTEQAAKELETVRRVVAAETAADPSAIGIRLQPALQEAPRVQAFHVAFTLGVVAVLIIASLNVATLQLSRGLQRLGEYATRQALGASRFRIVQENIAEAIVLCAPGILLGLLISYWAFEIVLANVPPNLSQAFVQPRWNWLVVTLAIAVPLAISCATSLIPGTVLSGRDVGAVLRGHSGVGQSRPASRLGSALVVVQVGLSVGLAIAAGALLKSAAALSATERGVDTQSLVYARIETLARDSAPRGAIATRLMNSLRLRHGVLEAAAIVLSGSAKDGVLLVTNRGPMPAVTAPRFPFDLVTPSYFKTLGIPIRRGRDFREEGEAFPAAIVSEAAARAWWPNINPIGATVRLGRDANAPVVEIIGLASDVVMDPAREEGLPPLVFSHSGDAHGPRLPVQAFEVFLRSRRPAQTALQIRLSSSAALNAWAETWDRYKGLDLLRLRHTFFAATFGGLAGLAILLSAIGLYALLEQRTNQRQREFSIRLALGASPNHLALGVMREAIVLALAGVALGLVVAKWGVGLLRAILLGLEPLDVVLFVSASGILLFCVILGSLAPALRIKSIEANRALREM